MRLASAKTEARLPPRVPSRVPLMARNGGHEGRTRSRGASRVSRESRLKQHWCSEIETGRRGEPRRTREACAHEPPRVLSPSRNVILPLALRMSPSSSLASSRRCPLSVPIGRSYVHTYACRPFIRSFVRIRMFGYTACDVLVLFLRDLYGRQTVGQ